MNLRRPAEVLRESLRSNRGIATSVWWNVVLLAGSLAALPFDGRRILGLNPWVKPIKFEISVIVFLLTMGLLLEVLEDGGRSARPLGLQGWGFGIAMIVEDSIIALQSARGVRSHMNYDTARDAMLFAVMGFFIALNSGLAAWLLMVWCVAKTQWVPALVWGIRLGLAMLLAASAEGARMVVWGSHTVGAPDGGIGLPFVNWSTQYGDLRVAHFFALHALQLFPLTALALVKTRWRERTQIGSLLLFAMVYGLGVWWLFAEAMRRVPLVRS